MYNYSLHSGVRVKQRIYNSKGRGHVTPTKSFVSSVSGNRINCTSKYLPHQSKREISRRRFQEEYS